MEDGVVAVPDISEGLSLADILWRDFSNWSSGLQQEILDQGGSWLWMLILCLLANFAPELYQWASSKEVRVRAQASLNQVKGLTNREKLQGQAEDTREDISVGSILSGSTRTYATCRTCPETTDDPLGKGDISAPHPGDIQQDTEPDPPNTPEEDSKGESEPSLSLVVDSTTDSLKENCSTNLPDDPDEDNTCRADQGDPMSSSRETNNEIISDVPTTDPAATVEIMSRNETVASEDDPVPTELPPSSKATTGRSASADQLLEQLEQTIEKGISSNSTTEDPLLKEDMPRHLEPDIAAGLPPPPSPSTHTMPQHQHQQQAQVTRAIILEDTDDTSTTTGRAQSWPQRRREDDTSTSTMTNATNWNESFALSSRRGSGSRREDDTITTTTTNPAHWNESFVQSSQTSSSSPQRRPSLDGLRTNVIFSDNTRDMAREEPHQRPRSMRNLNESFRLPSQRTTSTSSSNNKRTNWNESFVTTNTNLNESFISARDKGDPSCMSISSMGMGASATSTARHSSRLTAIKRKMAYGNKKKPPKQVISLETDQDDFTDDDECEDYRRRGMTIDGGLALLEVPNVGNDELEIIALAMKEGLSFCKIKVKGRGKKKKKLYTDCFSGSAAVDFLTEHLGRRRDEAKQIGRMLAQRYNLFIKCGGSKKKRNKRLSGSDEHLPSDSLQNSTLYDETLNNLDDSAPESEDGEGRKRFKASLLHDSRSIYYRMFAYLPSEVHEMPMIRKMKIFEEGVRVKKHRRGLKQKRGFSGKDAVNFLVQVRLVASREEAVTLCNAFVSEHNLFESVNRVDSFEDSKKVLYNFVEKTNRYFSIADDLSTTLVELQGNNADWGSDNDDIDDESVGMSSIDWSGGDVSSESESEEDEGSTHEHQVKDYQRLCEVAGILERGIKLKKNGTFSASRAVTFMVTSGQATSRRDGEALGRRLEREFNLFQETTGKHDFRDSNNLFRFSPKHERHMSPLKIRKPLSEIAVAFEQGVRVKDYTHNLKTHKNTFVGSKAVSFLVNSRLASNRLEAVRIGKQLAEQFNLFKNETGNREFCDDREYFRFTPIEERRSPATEEEASLAEDKNAAKDATFLSPSAVNPEELFELARWFLAGVNVRENKFRAKSYRQTFVGSEAVSFLVNSSKAVSRKDAVELCRLLSHGLGVFHGHDGSLDFRDDYLLYRFTEHWANEGLHGMPRASVQQGVVSGLDGITGVSAKSLPLEKVAAAFRSSMTTSEHRNGMKTYRNSFYGREGVDFFVGHGLAQNRVAAVDLGRALAREYGLFSHVGKQHEFKDAKHLYKFRCGVDDIRPLEVLELDKRLLTKIARDFLENVCVTEHQKNLLVFKSTFVGSEAVDFLVQSGNASSRLEAVQIGRAVTREFNVFQHITQDRKFEDSDALFYFEEEKYRYKGLLFSRQLAMRKVVDDDFSMTSGARMSFDEEDDTDRETEEVIALFDEKVQTALHPFRRIVEEDDDSVDVQRKQRINHFLGWASAYRRLDPRYQIQHFFDSLGQDGATNIENQPFATNDLSLSRKFLPSRSQFFTIWRPTSLDAIRRMMCGLAAGKGLDIKGKSAKRGKLSGYVPFLQIGTNKHKGKIRPPSKDGVVRVFYRGGESRRARDLAAEILERVAQEMIETVEKARIVLTDPYAVEAVRKDALESMLLEMKDPKIVYLDEYAPDRYGFEIPERLFWEAYFTRQDCTRTPGSQYDTGRPSQPAFQDMNFAALRAAPKDETSPRACVYQNADTGEPMNPFELLMAYEEDGRVMPLVSDFDCFLVGTRGVSFTSPLAPNQMDVLRWYVTQLEDVMAESAVGDSFTVKWLEVLKAAARDGIYPEMPQFGFGDPKSYNIMKSSVTSLKQTGAVRHGAECFNFYFPQDLDDEYLVIASDLPGNKPWVYVDQAGLQDFLMQKADEGFTFPLNPKWILCDAGKFYKLYQKLLTSDKEETQQSMNVWYPPGSGLREQIERVHQSRPAGFYEDELADMNDESSVVSKRPVKSKEHLMSMFAMGLLNSDTLEDSTNNSDTDSFPITKGTSKSPKKPHRNKLKKKKLFGKSLEVIQE